MITNRPNSLTEMYALLKSHGYTYDFAGSSYGEKMFAGWPSNARLLPLSEALPLEGNTSGRYRMLSNGASGPAVTKIGPNNWPVFDLTPTAQSTPQKVQNDLEPVRQPQPQQTQDRTKEIQMADSKTVNILAGAGTMIMIDQGVKFATRKLAKLALKSGRADLAEVLISKEGRDGAKLVAPATLLGVAFVLSKNENEVISEYAKNAMPFLEMATAAGLKEIGNDVISKVLTDEDDDIAEIKHLIEASRERVSTAANPALQQAVKTM